MAVNKEHAHELIEQLAPSQVSAVVGMLEALLDPVSRAIANAPVDDEPLTVADEQALVEAQDWLKHHEGIPHERVLAELGLTRKEVDRFREPSETNRVDRSSHDRCPPPEQAHRHASSRRPTSLLRNQA